MELFVLVKDDPRSLAVYSNSTSSKFALIFEKTAQISKPQCHVEFCPGSEFDFQGYRSLNSRLHIYGILGLIQVDNDIFITVVTECKPIGQVRPGESVYRIIDVEFYSLVTSSWDEGRTSSYDDFADDFDQLQLKHPCSHLRKLLANGNFYFSSDFDLTRNLQVRTLAPKNGKYFFDDRFLWNKYMISSLLNFRSRLNQHKQFQLDQSGALVLAIQGFFGRQEIKFGSEKVALSIISKLSCKRAGFRNDYITSYFQYSGTRFNTRGIDDDGNVANFVEVETILCSKSWCLSYTQIRGSVPVFWEQPGIQVMGHKVQISRGADATQPAVERHFTDLLNRYGEVYIINLLGPKEGEALLTREYHDRVRDLYEGGTHFQMTNFDFNTICKNGSYENVKHLLPNIRETLDNFEFFLLDLETDTPLRHQIGVFRTNCVDWYGTILGFIFKIFIDFIVFLHLWLQMGVSLDRTNVVQTLLSRTVLETYLRQLENIPRHQIEMLYSCHSHLWAENGDSLSKIYAGTGALKSQFTRSGKLTLAGQGGYILSVLGDASKSVNRFYINNFQDKSKQEVIDLLLGKLLEQQAITVHDPVHELVLKEIQQRAEEFSTKSNINLFVGTYNLNGASPSGESLMPWLFPYSQFQPDLVVIGFQEIVQLVPQQIVSADPEKLKIWEKEITKILNSQSAKYVILRSRQLVGTALSVYAKADVVSRIRNVECVTKKTGLGGMAGNKGAVAIRMDFYDTSLCFVTAHLAAGESNFDERNKDYHTINNGLIFRQGRHIANHDTVIWLGDFNYRVSLDTHEVRDHVLHGNLDVLLKSDQLIKQIQIGAIFRGYTEGPITFPPTYKYDNHSNHYDTSEKARVPSWTDRILFRGKNVHQIAYNRAELKNSDHRPVMALFKIEIIKYDEQLKEKIQQELYENKSKVVGKTLGVPEAFTTMSIDEPAVNLAQTFERIPVDTLIDLEDTIKRDYTHQWWNDANPSQSPVMRNDQSNSESRVISTNPFEILSTSPVQKEFPLIDSFIEFNNPNEVKTSTLIDISIPSAPPESDPSKFSTTSNWAPLIPIKVENLTGTTSKESKEHKAG
ncbi:hypothetical protein G9A89_016941 [Geosiphon pyriformis]|nr:hypothetical protein G9A89_016941 [Geosiphon pyriformis]